MYFKEMQIFNVPKVPYPTTEKHYFTKGHTILIDYRCIICFADVIDTSEWHQQSHCKSSTFNARSQFYRLEAL